MQAEPTIPARINPLTFPSQVVAASLGGLVYSCNETGVFCEGLNEANLAAMRAVVAAHDPDAELPAVAPVASCSRLGLMRAFREKGYWPTVKAMIASDADMQDEWDLATELRITDPIVQKAIAALPLVGLPPMPPDEVLALINRANELVA